MKSVCTDCAALFKQKAKLLGVTIWVGQIPKCPKHEKKEVS